ncbi:MAG: hydrogenase 4 subunit F [Chloroflexi bacterium]|nr:hydrogenase 4 subunit F [Chloroflexota bacterium]
MDLLLLLLIPLLTGVLCRAVSSSAWREGWNAVGATATLGLGISVALRAFSTGPVLALAEWLYVDGLSALLLLVIVSLGFLAALYSIGYLRHECAHGKVPGDQLGWYYLGFHVFIWTMLVTVVVNDLGLLWAAIEATTLVSALLVGFYRTKAALEAAWKYLILCTVGITLALFGVLCTYYAALQTLGHEAGLRWTTLSAHAGQLDPALMKVAFVFVVIGFGTKAGLAPLHTWLPDAHSQAPSPISALLSGVLLNCGLYGIVRVHLITSGATGTEFSSNLLLAFGLCSVAVATPFLLVQRDLKRLLAYSSVEHVGLIATAFGLGGPLGFYAGLLHLLNHALTKGLLFFVAGNLSQCYGTTRMARIRGVVEAAPLLGTLFLVGTLAITGVPPFSLFVSELGIFGAGFSQGKIGAAIAIVVALAIVFAGICGQAVAMAFGRPPTGLTSVLLGRSGRIALFVPTALVVLFGIYVPRPLSDVIEQVALLLSRGGGL